MSVRVSSDSVDEPAWLPRARELRERKWTYRRIAAEVGETANVVYYHLQRRSGNITRATRICAGCGIEFRTYEIGQRYHSRECYALYGAGVTSEAGASSRRAKLKRRRGRKNPNYKHGARADVRDRAGERRFVDVAARGCRHPRCRAAEHGMHQHHVVYRQELVRVNGDVWDPDNALQLCHGCHSSHHRRGMRIVPLSALRDENYAFAVIALGAGPGYEYLRRRYSGEDPRLAAILESL